MKEKLIRFLKDNHAFAEFKEEVTAKGYSDLDHALKVIDMHKAWNIVLSHDKAFALGNLITDIDWKELNVKWVEMLKAEELS